VRPPARGGTAQIAELAREYQAAAAAPNAPKNLSSGEPRFKSCTEEPLFRSNDLNEHVSRTPLHITLGLGTNYLKAVEARCAELDQNWALNVSDRSVTESWEEAVGAIVMAEGETEECRAQIASFESGMAELVSQDPKAARKGRVDGARDDGRIKYRRYQNELNELKASLSKLTAKEGAAKKAEVAAKEAVLKLTPEGAGPFGKRFKELLVALKISIKKYFGGTYIGPDLHKIFGDIAHIRMLCDTLKSGRFECPDGLWRTCGSDAEADALFSVLRPFGELHLLFNRKEALCTHEIARFPTLIEEHAVAFATVFPNTVPTLKMHILSMHMDELLQRRGSIGMDSEQGVECYHPEVTYVFNKYRSLDRQPEAQVRAVARDCWARGSGASVPEESDGLRAAKHARNEKQRMMVKLEKGASSSMIL
jgi:hypothetical protein